MIEKRSLRLRLGQREPAKVYIQESDLPLPMASDGTYAAAMVTVEDMTAFVDRLMREFDAAANMDWQLIDWGKATVEQTSSLSKEFENFVGMHIGADIVRGNRKFSW